MLAPPDAQTRSPVTGPGDRAISQSIRSNSEYAEAPASRQAQKLRRWFAFCHATACTLAELAFAGGLPR